MKAWLIAATAFVLVAIPRLAEACPFCAGTNDGDMGRYLVIGAMIGAPFLAVAIGVPLVIRAVRRTDEESSSNE